MKSMLAILADCDEADHVLQTALALARAAEAHLHCVQLIPNDSMVAFDGFGGAYVLTELIEEMNASATKLEGRLKGHLAKEDVSWSFDTLSAGINWIATHYGALADLIIVGRKPHRMHREAPPARLGEVVRHARSPLFIPNDRNTLVDPCGTAIVAWDGSAEAAVAARAAVPLLRLAENVQVVTVREKKGEFPGTRLLEYLSRHDIHAEFQELEFQEEWLEGVLTVRARTRHGYAIMGAYSHSRLGEYLYGGATRSMLEGSTIDVLMAH